MKTLISKRLGAVAIALALPLSALPAVHAAPTNNPVASPIKDANSQKVVVDDPAVNTEEVQRVAGVLEKLDNANSQEEAERILSENFTQEELEGGAAELGIATDELFAETPSNTEEGAGEFLQCMRDKAVGEFKDAFKFNAVAAALGRKKYFEAAVEVVKHLAKQGIRRNVAVTAAIIGWYGFQCRGSW